MIKFTQINRFFTAVCSIIIVSFLFNSCEKETLDEDLSLLNFEDSSVRRGLVNVNAVLLEENSALRPFTNCIDACIVPDSGEYYYISETKIGGNSQNVKEVGYLAYNTETEFIVDVIYNITSGNSNAEADITIMVNGTPTIYGGVSKGTKITHRLPLDSNWRACDNISLSIVQEELGQPLTFYANYSLVGICTDSSCEESFSYRAMDDSQNFTINEMGNTQSSTIKNKSYEFKYIPSEDISGAEIKFTCPHISDFSALDGKEYTVNPGNGNGSPTVLTWVGNLTACQEITFNLLFVADCDQTNSGFANVFTDFKVNGESKKGDLENIRVSCN